MSLLGRVLKRIRRDGLLRTYAMCGAALRTEQLYLYRLEQLRMPVRPEGVQVHSGLESLKRLRAASHVTADEFYCEDRPGFTHCHIATLEGRLAGIIWTLESRHASRYIELCEGEAELGYLHVLPWARGRGIAKLLYACAASERIRQGALAVYAVIAENNEPSRRAAEAVGFRWIASLRRRSIRGPRFRPRQSHGTVAQAPERLPC